MQQFDVPSSYPNIDMFEDVQQTEANLDYQREVLKYITDIGSSLRLDMDIDILLQRVAEASCKALRFRHSALYLADGAGYFHVRAVSGVSAENEAYLHKHPLPADVVAQLICEEYRISESYFIPAEAPLWRNEQVNNYFVVDEGEREQGYPSLTSAAILAGTAWHPEDMLVVPLITGDNTLLGFLTPDAPLDGRRPILETMALLELFANQAAVVIEGAGLYKEAQQTSEERAALIKIGWALSAPDALRDLQTVYQTIYEQIGRVMPADAFYISRYNSAEEKLIIEFFIDEGVVYPPLEYKHYPLSIKKILYQENVGYLFSTAEEYAEFIKEENPNTHEGLIGNARPSQSLLFTPIRHGGQVLGLLSAQSYQPHAYTRRHLEMLKEISVQAGIAITNVRLNTELRDALKRAQESEQVKNHFLMTASHELRTPLTAIQGYLELLDTFNAELDDESKQQFLQNARRACEELVLLLGNVMDTSRIDQDQVSLNMGPMQLVKAVQLILEILDPAIVREERPVQVHVADDVYVWADDLRLRQVLLNIVGNALKYTPAASAIAITATCVDLATVERRLAASQQALSPVGTPDPDTATFARATPFVLIEIRDWGPGINAEERERLFTKFMRLDNAINSLQRGTGLGLYLCRQLIEAMAGQIWVESTGIPGEGCIFAIALPRYHH